MSVKRPLAWFGFGFLAACLIGCLLPVSAQAIGAMLTVAISVAVLTVPGLRRFRAMLWVTVAVAAALAIVWFQTVFVWQPLEQLGGTAVTVSAVAEPAESGVVLRVTQGDLPRGTKMRCWSFTNEPMPYSTVEGTWLIQKTTATGFSQIRHRASGVAVTVIPKAEPTVLTPQTGWQAVTYRIRSRMVFHLRTVLEGDIGEVIAGLCLGEDARISDAAIASFRTVGLSHLFAVSGLHLSVILSAVLWLLRRVRLPRFLQSILAGVAIVLFIGIVGPSASVIRAGVMAAVVLLGRAFRRPADAMNSLGTAIVLLLLTSPYAVYDAGLLLSVSATAGLLYLAPALNGILLSPFHGALRNWIKPVVAVMAVSLSATVATVPATTLFYGSVSLLGVLSNLLATAAATALLILGWIAMLCLLCGAVTPARLLLLIGGYLSRYLLAVCRTLSAWPLATVSVRGWLFPLMVAIGAIACAVCWHRSDGRRYTRIAAATAVCLLCSSLLVRQCVTCGRTTVDVPSEKVPFAVVTRADRAVILVNAESGEAKSAVYDALQSAGVRRVDAVCFLGGGRDEHSRFIRALSEFGSPQILCDAAHRTCSGEQPATALRFWNDGTVVLTPDGVDLKFGKTELTVTALGRPARLPTVKTATVYLASSEAVFPQDRTVVKMPILYTRSEGKLYLATRKDVGYALFGTGIETAY